MFLESGVTCSMFIFLIFGLMHLVPTSPIIFIARLKTGTIYQYWIAMSRLWVGGRFLCSTSWLQPTPIFRSWERRSFLGRSRTDGLALLQGFHDPLLELENADPPSKFHLQESQFLHFWILISPQGRPCFWKRHNCVCVLPWLDDQQRTSSCY